MGTNFLNKIYISFVGSVQMPYYMAGSQDVPEHIKMKVEKATSSMIESGFYQFYEGFAMFITKLLAKNLPSIEADDDEWRALTVDNLKAPLIFCLCLMGFAWFVFILEILIHKIKMMKTPNKIYKPSVRSENQTVD